jgi:hypothetical protein
MTWDERVDRLWASIEDHDEVDFRDAMDALVAQRPSDDPRGLYEQASAWDSTGHSDRAVPLYRQALDQGLLPPHRRQAVVQLASSLRNLGQAAEGVALLQAERERGSDEYDDGVSAFLALALVDAGHERDAVSVALLALAGHMTRYQRSVTNYARLLVEGASGGETDQ